MANSFSLDVAKFAENFEDGAEKAMRGVSLKLFTAIIKSTPIDEGRARANWFTTTREPSTKTTSSTDKAGSISVTQAQKVIVGVKDWSVFTLTNNLPYIEVLEFGGYKDGPKTVGGFSKQAPQGFLRVNINRFNKMLEQEAKKQLPK